MNNKKFYLEDYEKNVPFFLEFCRKMLTFAESTSLF